MFGKPKLPRDRYPYPRSSRSHPLKLDVTPGQYVYVVDVESRVWIAPDEPHAHPKVLGSLEAVLYAGDLTIAEFGVIEEITNLSGTFRFRSRLGLLRVCQILSDIGYKVKNAIWHDHSGLRRPLKLNVKRFLK